MSVTVAQPTEPKRSSPAPTSVTFTHRQIMTILGALMLGMLLAALDQTIVATAIRTIADDLNGLSLQAWVTSAYLMTATISTPLYGKLSDLYGRKPCLLTAISVFIVGSVLCTMSTSMYELAAFRAVQGLGAGGLISLALAVLGDVVPPRERARYQSIFLAVFGTASVVGPLAGGAFAGMDSLLGIAGWRWVFLVNVPIAAVALVVVAKVLNLPHTPRQHRIDWPGALTLAVAVVPVLLVAEQGQSWGWASGRAILCYTIALVGLVGFFVAERWLDEDAVLPLRLFRNSVFSLSSAAGLIIGMGMFGGIVLIPLYLQIVQGATPTEAGLLLLPLMAGIMAASMLSGQVISRTGRYKIFPVLGTALLALALLILHFRVAVDTPLWEVELYLAVFGLGLGGCLQTLILVVQNAVPARDMGVATASSTFFRQMGGTLGVAVFLSILFAIVGGRIADGFRAAAVTPEFRAALADPAVRANPDNDVVLQAMQNGGIGSDAGGVLQDSSFLQHIDPRLARPFLIGFSEAMDVVFLFAAGVMFIAFVLMLFLKEVPLRTQSGIEARAAELGAEAGAASRTASMAVGPAPVRTLSPVGPAARPVFNGNGNGNSGTRSAPEPDPAISGALWWRRSRGKQSGPAVPPSPAPGPAGPGPAGPGPAGPGPAGPGPAGPEPAVPEPPATQPVGTGQLGTDQVGAGQAGTDHVVAGSAPPAAAPGPAATDHQPRPVIFGQITERGHGPLSGATLTLTDLNGRQLDRDSSDRGGHYRLGPPTGGSYLVICASAAHQPTAALVAVADLPVRHDVALSGAGASLSGSVCTAGSGEPMPNAVVTLVDVHGDVVGASSTDAEGRFTFLDLAQGLYTLTVAAPALHPVARSVEVPASGHIVHDVEVAARVQLVGTVRTATAGVPVPEALTTLIASDGHVVASVLTDTDGGFVFDDLNTGVYTIIATGYPPVAAEVHLDAGAPTETVITLRPPTAADPAVGNGAVSSTEWEGDEHGTT